MQRIILFCVALLIAHTSMGQKNVNYNDLYKSLGSMRDFEAYWALFQYLQATTSKDFANPNAYYHVGRLMQKSMRETDPFLDTKNVQEYISQANLYLSLSKRALKDTEFRKYSDFYPEVKPQGQRLTMNDVIRDTDARVADVNEFKAHFEEALLYLTKSVNSYNMCITTFGEINQENNRLNDLYFLVDDKLQNKLNSLGENFDSTLFYLNKFKESLEKYHLGGYQISYSLKQIPVYRLYGLNSSDFLSKNISLWDFRSWLKSFNEVTDTEVAFLYKSAQDENRTNTGYVKNLLNMDTRGVVSNYKMNPLIVNKMLKYDFNSATAALLSYQEAKVNYLYSIADNKTGGDLASFDKASKSPDVFLTMVRQKNNTDELLAEAKTKTNPESIKKYAKFYEENYNGYNGYTQYLEKETTENELVMQNALNGYKDRILKSHIRTGGEKTINYNSVPIFLQIISPASLPESSGYFIHSKTQLANNGMFIAGTHVADRQNVAFAALTDSMGAVMWLKEFKQGNDNNHAMLTAMLNDGFAVVVSTPANDAVKSRMLLLDANGNTKTTKDLNAASVPQKLIYDDIAQNYVLAFKGGSFMPYSASDDELQIYMLNAKLEPVWNKSLTFDGYLSNVIKTDDNYYIYGAYGKMTDGNGKQYNTEANRMNMFVYPVNAGGAWLNVSTFDAPFSYYPLHVTKINNEYVDVIAIKDAQAAKFIEDKNVGGTPYYMIIHSNSDVYYQYTAK